MIRGTSDAEFLGEDPVLRSCEVVYDTTNKRLKIAFPIMRDTNTRR